MSRCRSDGYFVLRFLAEDLGKRLDEVLDGILRALAHQSRTTTAIANSLVQTKRPKHLFRPF